MIKKVSALIVISFLAFFSGCINSETIVKVKPDGSGEIHETILFSQALVGMMSNMQASMSSGNDSAKAPGLFDIEKLRKEVSKYGSGVEFVSATEKKNDKGEGYTAIYSFKDINQVKLDQNPGSKVDKGSSDKSVEEKMSFKMEKGKVSTLKVKMNNTPSDKNASETENTKAVESSSSPMDSAATQQMMEQMMKMFNGMRIKIAVEIDGEIVKTNATHREENVLTLLDMDFEKLTKDAKAFENFSKANPKTIAETKELIKDVEGMKIDFNKELLVKFK